MLQKELKNRFAKKTSMAGEPKTPAIGSGPSQTVSFLRAWFDDTGRKYSVEKLVIDAITHYYSDQASPKLLEEMPTHISSDKIAAYEKLCTSMIAEEQKMPNYYTFYHAHNYAINLIFDINKIINEWLSINVGASVVLRVPTVPEKTIDQYIDRAEKYFQEHPVSEETIRKTDPNFVDLIGTPDDKTKIKYNVWDNYATYEDAQKVKHSFATELLSVSPFLFSNIGRGISDTFMFFIESFSVLNVRKVLNTFFDAWGFNKRFIPELLFAQYTYLQTLHGGGMLQIFVPKENVDKFVYLAHSKGTPYREKLTESFSETKHRHMTISDILQKCIDDPFSFNKDVLQKFEARIVFLPDFFTPSAGIMYKTYDFAPPYNKEQYVKTLNDIVQRMLTQWISSDGFEKLSGDTSNKPAIKLLQLMKAGEKFKEEQGAKTKEKIEPKKVVRAQDALIGVMNTLKSKLQQLAQQLVSEKRAIKERTQAGPR